jgi:polysaccharide biosynthesis protein PslG
VKGSFDVLGAHAAGYKSPPDLDPATGATNPALTNNDPSSPQLKRSYFFRHVEDLRQIMVQQGDGDHRVAVTEMGWTSDSRPDSPYLWHSVTEQQKADYLTGAFRYARANWSWMAFMTVIYLPDPQWTKDQEQVFWSITNLDGSPLPAYTELKQYFHSDGS